VGVVFFSAYSGSGPHAPHAMALGSFYSWRLDNPRRWEFLVWRLARLTGATDGMQNIAKTLQKHCQHHVGILKPIWHYKTCVWHF
jgi:hypothetical protein